MLGKDELPELVKKFKETGDEDARRKILLAFQQLVVKIAREIGNRKDYDVDDLISEGNIGLINALKTYDPLKGSLGNHIYNTVRGYLGNAIKGDRLVHLPSKVLSGRTIPPPYALIKGISIDAAKNEEGGEAIIGGISFLAAETEENETSEENEIIKTVRSLLEGGTLTSREKTVVMEHIFKERKLVEISLELGISTARVYQIYRRALEKCKERLQQEKPF